MDAEEEGSDAYSSQASESDSETALRRRLDELMDRNEQLEQENVLFEHHLMRHDPELLEERDLVDDSRKPRWGKRRITAKQRQKASLKPEQKFDIATLELEEIRKEIENAKETSERLLDGLKAGMDEVDQEIKELKKEEYEFRRDIVQGAVYPRSGKIMAEKLPRYFEERLRSRDALIEKLRLKNTTLRAQVKKATLQLSQKEEMGEVLHAIDFEQLKIENQQYQEKIEERNQELLRLKVTAGNTVQVLNTFKKKLGQLMEESAWLTKNIGQREDQLSKIDSETYRVEDERVKAKAINRKLKEQREEYKVPGVMEYVKQKATVGELRKKVKDWERKVEIAAMGIQRERRLLKAARRDAGMGSRQESSSAYVRAGLSTIHL